MCRSAPVARHPSQFTFYDGPPFATGLPHYGHILAGTIKDIVTRYASQTGHHVTRRFGWDCHGLPVEFEIDKKLGIKGRDDVLAMGIDKYNAECRGIVTRYCAEWETIVTRLGRWIDFKNDYKTMVSKGALAHSVSIPVHVAIARWYAPRPRFPVGHQVHGVRVVGLLAAVGEGPRLPLFQGHAVFNGVQHAALQL